MDDGITTKVASIGEESQLKLQDTMRASFYAEFILLGIVISKLQLLRFILDQILRLSRVPRVSSLPVAKSVNDCKKN